MNQLALKLKRAGIERVSARNGEFLERIRNVAYWICTLHGTVTSDQLHANYEFNKAKYPEPTTPNAWGAIFHHKDFVWTGQYVKSKRPERHAGEIKVWRLRHD